MKRLNLRLAIILGVIAIACVGGIILLHEMQVRRNAGNLLTESRELKNKEDFTGAVRALKRYVTFHPEDVEALEEMLEIHKKLFKEKVNKYTYSDLLSSYERLIALRPTDAELRRDYMKFCMSTGNPAVAQQQLEAIRNLKQMTPEDEFTEASMLRIKSPDLAIPILAKIIGFDPESKKFDPEVSKNCKQYLAYNTLAQLYQQQAATADLAEKIIDELIAQHPEELLAQQIAFDFWSRKGKPEKAQAALSKAVELSPDSQEVLYLQFAQYFSTRDYDSALKIAERLEKTAPKEVSTYLNLAKVYEATKQREKVLETLDRGLTILGNVPALLVPKLQLTIHSVSKDTVAARDILSRLQGSQLPAEKFALYEGQLLILEKKYNEALDKLIAASKRLTEPQDQIQAELALAECYKALGSYDLAKTIYAKILNAYPGLHEARINLANLLLVSGKLREAQHEFELLYQVMPEVFLAQPRLWQPLLDTRIGEQLAKPAENRDWKSVNSLLAKLKELPVEVLTEQDKALLQARVFARQGDLQSALGIVLPLREQQPDNVKLWFEWSVLESQRGKPKELLEQLAKAPQAVQNDQRMLLILANQWAAIGGDEGKAGLLEVLNKTAAYEQDDRLTIHLLISQALARMGKLDDAEKVALQAIPLTEGIKPRDLRPQQVLLSYARDRGDIPAMEKLYELIRKESAPDSDLQLYSQSMLILTKLRESQKKKIHNTSVQVILDANETKLLQEAQTLADKLLEKRSDWVETHKLLADIAVYRNNIPAMINALKTARSKGELEPNRLRQLAQLLYQTGEYKDSEAIIDQLVRQGDISLFKMKFQLLVQEGKKAEAEELLKKIVLTERASPAERVWLAQAYRLIGRFEKAEELVRTIVDKDEKLEVGEAWLLLASLLREQKKTPESNELLDRVRRLPASETQLLISARVAETIGELEVANQLFPQMVQQYPESLLARRELASFYLRQKMDQLALSTLDQLLQLINKNPNAPLAEDFRVWANRAKVVTDVASGLKSYEEFVNYDNQLKKAIEDRPDEINDLVLRISLLTQRQEAESLRKAIELLQEFNRRQPLQTEYQLLLARLYSKVGEWSKGRPIIEALALKPGADPRLLVAYAEMLVQNEEYATAQRYIERYVSQTKDRQPYLILLGTIYGKTGDKKRSEEVIREWLGKRPVTRENLPKLELAAKTFQTLGNLDAAEEMHRELATSGLKGQFDLAKFIGENRDLNAGLAKLQEIYEQAGAPVAPMLVHYGADLLRNRGTEVSDAQKAEAFKRLGVWFQAYKSSSPDQAELNTFLAELRVLQDNYAEAAQLYRDSINLNKDKNSLKVASLRNNLAYVLALTGNKANYPEALEAIEQAIRTMGPQSDLLDTRGLLFIQMGEYAKAERDLADAVLSPDATKFFRLAYSQFKLGKRDEALVSIRKAREEGLKQRALSPPEQSYYEDMRKGLGDEAFALNVPRAANRGAAGFPSVN